MNICRNTLTRLLAASAKATQWRATLGSAGLAAALEGAERFALPPPPAIASVGTQEPMVRRLFPGRELDSNLYGAFPVK